MCTAFVYRGKDRICGFNMDLPDGMDWKLFTDEDCFYVGLRPAVRTTLLPAEMKEIPEEYMPCSGEYLRLQGVNRKGDFGNQLNALDFTGAPFEIAENTVPLYSLVDRFLCGKTGVEEIIDTARKKRIVNMPPSAAGLPDPAMHSLLSDGNGRILMLEPGNGYAEIRAKYAVMSNFPMLILPGDLTEKTGYYGVDRYETAVKTLRAAGDGLSPEDGLSILNAVKQEQYAPTRISFVYSQNENRVYYALERDYGHVRTHQF